MERFFLRFVSEDKGAVTVDWVVLCAGIVTLAAAIFGSIQDGTTNMTSETAQYLDEREAGNF